MNDSIHVPKPTSIINLPFNDLWHKLNTLLSQPNFAFILTFIISGNTRLVKIDFITTICKDIKGYNDYNWKFHDQQAQIILEFINQTMLWQALLIFNKDFPNIKFNIIQDLRHLLSKPIYQYITKDRYNIILYKYNLSPPPLPSFFKISISDMFQNKSIKMILKGTSHTMVTLLT